LEIKIVKDEENKLLNRRDLQISIDHPSQGTPKRADLHSKLAAQLGVKPELVFITGTKTLTGKNSTICNVEVYSDTKRAQLVVPEHIRMRTNPAEAAAKKEKEKQLAAKAKESSKEKPKVKASKPAK
jgi:ribosomal protein S24E